MIHVVCWKVLNPSLFETVQPHALLNVIIKWLNPVDVFPLEVTFLHFGLIFNPNSACLNISIWGTHYELSSLLLVSHLPPPPLIVSLIFPLQSFKSQQESPSTRTDSLSLPLLCVHPGQTKHYLAIVWVQRRWSAGQLVKEKALKT